MNDGQLRQMVRVGLKPLYIVEGDVRTQAGPRGTRESAGDGCGISRGVRRVERDLTRDDDDQLSAFVDVDARPGQILTTTFQSN